MTHFVDASPAAILHEALVGLDVLNRSNAVSWPAWVGNLPDLPHNAIVLFDTSPVPQARLMETGEVKRRWGVQILVRSRDDRTAGWRRIMTITQALEQSIQNTPVSLKGDDYLIEAASIASGPFDLGREKETTARFLFSVNATLAISPGA